MTEIAEPALLRLSELVPEGGWLGADAPRFAPQDGRTPRSARLAAWTIRRVAKLDAANLFVTLAGNWTLFLAWLPFAARLVPWGGLDRQDSELVVLRVAWSRRCRYEWGQHVDIAQRAGLTAEQVARVTRGSAAPGWTPRQAALLDAVDEIVAERVVSPPTWQRLQEHFDSRLLLELCMLAGHYDMLAGVLATAGIPLDAPLERRLAEASC